MCSERMVHFSSLLGTGAGYRREDTNWSLGELAKSTSPFRMMCKGCLTPSQLCGGSRERREVMIQLLHCKQ